MATVFYAFQIYFDFAGYTDMAIGSARLFNIDLSKNFNSPYLAVSISDFWRRWHMTFSRWILDYIFKPLQMKWRDRGNVGTAIALLVTFLVSGIWHGAAWGFIVWGLLHGTYMACSVFWKPYRKRLYQWLGVEKSTALKVWQVAVTFALICLSWIFFRADTLENGWYVATHLLSLPSAPSHSLAEFMERNLLMGQSVWDFYLTSTLLALMGIVGFICRREKGDLPEIIARFPAGLRWGAYYGLLFGIVFGGVFENGTFIYFQF